MKTIKKIKAEIKVLQKTDTTDLSPGQMKKIHKEAEQLNQYKLYLETNPSEEFLKKQHTELSAKLDKIDESFANWYNNNSHFETASKALSSYIT